MSSATLNQSLIQDIRQNLSAYAALPPAGDTWQARETDLDGGDINRLVAKGAITVVGTADGTRVWKTRQPVWDELQRRREDLGVLACGHRPFSTVDLDSERPYSCLGEDCDARYTRTEIEAVIGGE
jgi:hypothetical protein